MAYQVNITHYVNPHLFYFCKINTSCYLKVKAQIEKTEQTLAEYNAKKNAHPTPEVGDEVAVYFLSWERFIRARVDYIAKIKGHIEYTVWALDYGFPFQTNVNFVYDLPRQYCGAPTHIKRGGLANIFPAEMMFYMGEAKVRQTNNWHEGACNIMEEQLKDSWTVSFKEILKRDDHYWGELTVTNTLDQEISLSDLLLKNNFALPAAHRVFFTRCANLSTTQIEPWLNNSRNYIRKVNDIKSTLLTKDTPNHLKLNANSAKYHILKVREWQCGHELSDSETEENIESIKPTTLGMSILTEQVESREVAVQKFCHEKEENVENWKMGIYEAHKVVLPKAALEALNTSTFFEDEIDNKQTNSNNNNKKQTKGSSEKSDEAALTLNNTSLDSDILESYFECKQMLKTRSAQDVANETNSSTDQECASDKNKVLTPNKKNNMKHMIDFFKDAKRNLIPAGMECDTKNLTFDLPNTQKLAKNKKNEIDLSRANESVKSEKDLHNSSNLYKKFLNEAANSRKNLIPAGMECTNNQLLKNLSVVSKNSTKNLIDFSSATESPYDTTTADTASSSNIYNTSGLYKRFENDTKESSSLNLSSNKLLMSTSDTESFANDEQDIRTPLKDESSSDSCLDALLRFTQKNKDKPKILKSFPIANSQNDQILNFGDERHFKIADHMVLAHSNEYLKSVKKLENSYLVKSIFERMMEMKIDKIFRVQAYSWAHIMLKHSVFIVGAGKTGKTWAYVPQICSLVAQQLLQTQIQERKRSPGAVALILVASAQHVEDVANICEQLLSAVKQQINLNIVKSFGIFDTQEVKMDLLNGCGILITTVPSLERLIEDDFEIRALLNVTRLKHIVVDDLDEMMCRNKIVTEQVLKKLLAFTQKQKPQLVVISRYWEKLLVSLLKFSVQPVLLFGDFLEAAVYGRASLRIKLCTQERKIQAIAAFLKENPIETQRCIIFCNTTDEVDAVVGKLQAIGEKCLVYDDRANIEAINTPSKWQKGLISGVLVCMDTAFCDANIKNAHTLIHYSMPDTWTKFTKRFACLANNHENILLNTANNSKEIAEVSQTKSLILLDGENNEQLPRLFDFLRIHNNHELIHQDVLTVCEHVKKTREQTKVLDKVPLCSYLLEFGNCEKSHCLLRHQLADYDADNDLPKTGELQIRILKIHSVTHYSARLLRHKSIGENKWQNVRRSNEFTVFHMQLNIFYGQLKSKIPFWPLQLETICIYHCSKNYQRAVLLEIPTLKHPDVIQNVFVKVYLIDQGITVSDVASNSLLVCEEQFKEFPAQAVNIRLQDIIPVDNERTWDRFTTSQVQKSLVESLTKQQVVQVTVNGAFANTIWTKAVVVMEHLPTINQSVCHLNLKNMLLEKKYAMRKSYETAIDAMLKESMKKNTINVAQINAEITKEQSIESKEPATFVEKWLKLPMNKLSSVELGNEANNGHWNCILVQITDALEKEIFNNLCAFINEQLAAQKTKSPIENLDLNWFTVGRCCVIKHENEQYLRAKIVDIMNINDENRKVRFFLCDFAAFVTKDLNMELYNDFLYETNKEIIEYTPYQAVHCTLAGIEVRDLVTEYYFLTKTFAYTLALNERKQTELRDVFQLLNINSYEIILYESDEEVANENASMLNKALVDNGFASVTQASLLDIKIVNYLNEATEEKQLIEVAHDDDEVEEDYYEKMQEITSLIESMQLQNSQEEAEKEKKNKLEKTAEKIKHQENNTDIPLQKPNNVCVLKPLYKHPKVIWHQDDYFIFITIHAPDVKDFYVKINKNTIYYCARINGEPEMCILNLLDTVVVEKSWHELVGLNLKLRLLKTQFVMWPRLLVTSHKFSWLHYELDKVKATEKLTLARTFRLMMGYLPDDLNNNNNHQDDNESDSEDDLLAQIYKDDDADLTAED